MPIRTLDDLDAEGKRLGVRIDINSPLDDGELVDDARFWAHLETLEELTDAGGRIAVLAHQGRPGEADFGCLAPHAERLDELIEAPVGYVDATFSSEARGAVEGLADGDVVVLENTRFYAEESIEFAAERAAETFLVRKLAGVLDAYVNDAFAAAHRSQPSLVGFGGRLPCYAGRVMERELEVLGSIDETDRPRVYLLGGTKITDSLHVADSVLARGLADTILPAGVIANVFLFAQGADLGDETEAVVRERDSWDTVEWAGNLLERHGGVIQTPVDVAAPVDGARREFDLDALPAAGPVYDLGEKTIDLYAAILEEAATAICNGPIGVFEEDGFDRGTRRLYAAAAGAGCSIVGGGDTAAALRRFDLDGFDHVSTGGGAAIRMLTGESLPAVEALRHAD